MKYWGRVLLNWGTIMSAGYTASLRVVGIRDWFAFLRLVLRFRGEQFGDPCYNRGTDQKQDFEVYQIEM